MVPLLLDEGVPPSIARAFRELELEVFAVGEEGAPPRRSPDGDNVKWCADRGAVLVTNDRGKKDRAILDALAQHRVHALFVHEDLTAGPPHILASALLKAESKIEAVVRKTRGLLRHRLRPGGGIEAR